MHTRWGKVLSLLPFERVIFFRCSKLIKMNSLTIKMR